MYQPNGQDQIEDTKILELVYDYMLFNLIIKN